MSIVQSTVDRNCREPAEQRGFVVPAAPDGDLFFEEGAPVFPEFVVQRRPERLLHCGPVSAIFPVLTGFPGYLIDATAPRVKALSSMCIDMHAASWTQSEQFHVLGQRVRFTQPHRLETLASAGAARLFNQFEEARPGCHPSGHPAKWAPVLRHTLLEMLHLAENGMLY